ncbi:MAG: aldehyde dehydrogenase family protein [Acidobacteriota bacterium]|jgi:aldehyde dehydrogenase (NAD+)
MAPVREKIASAGAAGIQSEVDRIFTLQEANRSFMKKTTAAERKEKIRKLMDALTAEKEAVRAAVYADFQKPPAEADLSEIYPVVIEAKHALRHLDRWMKPHKVKGTLGMLGTRSHVLYEPKGIVLIISPWNFPFNLTLGPLVSALAAGNCAVLKPSEYTPHSSAVIRKLIGSVFNENEVAVVEGGPDTAKALLKKRFDHIFFTGSTATGRLVMKAAAENLTPVTLELGGKSPVIVDDTADLEDAARKIAWGKFMNTGQTCIAPDYLFIHERVLEPFLDRMRKRLSGFYGKTAPDRAACRDFGRIVNDGHYERLSSYLKSALEAGAKAVIGGETDPESRYIAPTVLVDVPDDCPVMREEIFGPILPVYAYRELDAPIDFINGRERPLALYVFSRDARRVNRILHETTAGGTVVNDTVVHFLHPNLPFGGINWSGFGKAHGRWGFEACSNARAVLRRGWIYPLKFMQPPYNRKARKFIDFTVKHF